MSKESEQYIPIDCGLHSEIELAIMRGLTLPLSWLDQNGIRHSDTVQPLDLKTRDRQEFLLFRTGEGVEYEIRLDRIIHPSI